MRQKWPAGVGGRVRAADRHTGVLREFALRGHEGVDGRSVLGLEWHFVPLHPCGFTSIDPLAPGHGKSLKRACGGSGERRDRVVRSEARVGQLAAAIGRKMPDTLEPLPAADPPRVLLRDGLRGHARGGDDRVRAGECCSGLGRPPAVRRLTLLWSSRVHEGSVVVWSRVFWSRARARRTAPCPTNTWTSRPAPVSPRPPHLSSRWPSTGTARAGRPWARSTPYAGASAHADHQFDGCAGAVMRRVAG
jgi:hypothetical protein